MLLDDTGQQVKVADFGTSIRCDSYLQDNSPKGTEAFMAPEVCNMMLVSILLSDVNINYTNYVILKK